MPGRVSPSHSFEHGDRPKVLEAQRRWLDGSSPVGNPAVPANRGEVTIPEVLGAADPAQRAAAIERWARSAWDTYATLPPLARTWTEEAQARR